MNALFDTREKVWKFTCGIQVETMNERTDIPYSRVSTFDPKYCPPLVSYCVVFI